MIMKIIENANIVRCAGENWWSMTDGYTTGEMMPEIIIDTLRLQDNHLLKTTELRTE